MTTKKLKAVSYRATTSKKRDYNLVWKGKKNAVVEVKTGEKMMGLDKIATCVKRKDGWMRMAFVSDTPANRERLIRIAKRKDTKGY